MPAHCWDADVLNGNLVKKHGRTGAKEFVEKKAYVYYETGSGDRCYAMRRSLYRFDDENESNPKLLEEGDWLGGLSEEVLRLLVKLWTCQSLPDATFVLQRLGVRNTTEELLRFCQRYCVVVIGPKAKELWGRPADAPVPCPSFVGSNVSIQCMYGLFVFVLVGSNPMWGQCCCEASRK